MTTSLPTDTSDLLPHLLMLTDTEREVATILSFDPDATIPRGALHGYRDEPRRHPVSIETMDPRAWRKLALACACPAQRADEATFAHFLTERGSLVGVVPTATVKSSAFGST